MDNYKQKIKKVFQDIKSSDDYNFLKTNPHLQNNIIMLGLGGSYAYGTYTQDSDIDIRGIAGNSYEEILLGRDFEQVVQHETDTTIYSLKKMIRLLVSNNPNTMEILGLIPSQILYSNEIYDELVRNKELFLSKMCAYTFGGYANQQLRRLETKSARLGGQEKKEQYILNSIQSADYLFKERYARMEEDDLKLYLDTSDKEDFEKEIFVDVSLSHYPLRDFSSLISDYRQIVKEYDKVGIRNRKALEHNKLGKHMMHLVRLYHMAFEILEDGMIRTYREKDRDFLMEIRNGKFLDENRQVLPEFYEIVEEYDEKLKRLKITSPLPEKPDKEKVDKLLLRLHEQLISSEQRYN